MANGIYKQATTYNLQKNYVNNNGEFEKYIDGSNIPISGRYNIKPHLCLNDQIYHKVQLYLQQMIGQSMIYGANLFEAENGEICMTPMEYFEMHGLPDIFKNIISSISRVERPLKIKQVSQKVDNHVIITQFDFEDEMKDSVCTELMPTKIFIKNKHQYEAAFRLFEQTFEDPYGSRSIVKSEFEDAFSPDEDKDTEAVTLAEIIYVKKDDKKEKSQNQIIGCSVYNLRKDPIDMIVNIDYSLVDKSYRIGLMTFINFRLGFSLGLLYPHLKPSIFYCAAHLNSWKMIEKELVSPKYVFVGADRVTNKMAKEFDDDVNVVRKDTTWRRDDKLYVKGGYFKPGYDINQYFFYKYIMGFEENPQTGELTPPKNPVSALIYAPITEDFFMRMSKNAKFHGFDFDKLVADLGILLPKLSDKLSIIFFNKHRKFPKAVSLYNDSEIPPKPMRSKL